MSKLNWANQTIWTSDNLPILRGLNSASVDLIYLDPPFNSNANYAAPIGSAAAGAEFKDTWGLNDINLAWHGEIKHEYPGLYDLLNATRKIHGDSMMSYLIYMAIRIMEMKRLLKETGTVYLHCDPTAGHYLKLLMDSVFGQKNFISQIIWNYGTPSGGRTAGKKPVKSYENLLVFAANYGDHTYNHTHTPYSDSYVTNWFRHEDETGRRYQTRNRKGKVVRQYLDESPGVPLSNTWSDIKQLYGSSGWFPSTRKEITNYPTQKPLQLLRRIIRISSNAGDVVLDPFCGCATTCIAAQDEGRQWIGIDISAKAADLVKTRIKEELGLMFVRVLHRCDIPKRTDQTKVVRYNSSTNKKQLYGEQGGYCNGCKTHFQMRHLTVDHIIPRSQGGGDHISNLQLLCRSCNSIKGDRSNEFLLACLTDKGWIKREQEQK